MKAKMPSSSDFNYYKPTKPDTPNLVFIHGAGGDKTQWEKQRIFFQQYGWGVISLSLPSHGQSPHAVSLSLDNYVETVYEILINQNLENVVLIGHSMGGAIALQFTLKYPGSIIDKLILIGTGAKLKVAPTFFDAIETDFDRFLELLGRFAFHEKTIAQIKLENEKALRRNGGAIILQDFKICDSFDIRLDLHKITKQTLIIVGQDDQMTPVKYSTFLHENIKNSQLSIIPEAGHYVFQEKPLVVNTEIHKFLS
ncbi:MAG: alpha/beta hydrolase [Candidatus Heimdallarchaeota archaeon]|nr:MAG: alpha/beta hydrolase [Candidatus Heimdallarchaeota archaeon]